MPYRNQKPLIDRLPKRLLEQLRKRKITNAEAAAEMGVCETYLSRVVASIQTKEPGKVNSARVEAAKLAAARRLYREQLAKDVKNEVMDLGTAAVRANCSIRTMQRYVAAYVPPKRKPRKAK